MRVWFLVAVLGCGPGLPAAAPTVVAPQVVAKPPHVAFQAVPADLIDDAAIDRIRHRVRVRRFGPVAATHGEPIEPVISRVRNDEVDRIMPVIDESSSAIRVVTQGDDARLALWIDRRDAWPTLLVPMQLADREGRVAPSAGAWLDTGAPIDVAFGRDRVKHVTLRDPAVAVDGWLPASVLGFVWLAPAGARTELGVTTTTSYRPPKDARPKTRFVPSTIVRAAPTAASAIVAVILDIDTLGFVTTAGAWTEVEVPRPYARVRGFVRREDLVGAGDDLGTFGTGGGHGFGMSHTQQFVVPAGTCLFDKPGGEVVGVQLEESSRYGVRETDVDGWSRVYVDSPWAVIGVFVHDTGSDPKQPVWESCAGR